MLSPWSCADWITVLPACGPPVITWSKLHRIDGLQLPCVLRATST
jgi:hypothetical protein